ncbi:hypothetical protein DL89DRAFT_286800 [Linderina pennispora]|uniref:Ketosynthase family 3 (KS3) domain-containing protein n=1 Tax=Linderina pennispora TaxID=61395 RepID=A0A1Y1VWP5_9FUNG|nr:uncharacterized protein DL89DRAFT_286800 [Linderina pennispora]ORX65709.1 hypothetical protein DL89DRAFT_286800 [Linderina pennispora]
MLNSTIALHGVAINVPKDVYGDASYLASEFVPSNPTAPIIVLSEFIEYCSTKNSGVAIAAFQHFHASYCSVDNIHVVILDHKLSRDQAHAVLRGYYSVWTELESRGILPDVPRPALFTDGKAKLVAMFGGQDGMNDYFEEGALVLHTFHTVLHEFVNEISGFVRRTSCDKRLAAVYKYPLDMVRWITLPDTRPPAQYLSRTPVSIVTVAVVQLMHLMVLYKTLRLSPGELSRSFKGAIGHCQGLVFATLFASLTDEQSFYDSSKKALGILMVAAAKNQMCTPQDTLNSDSFAEYIYREGTPSPMVAVRGINRPTIDALIARFNQHSTRPTDCVFLAIINSHDSFVVTGRTTVVFQFMKMVRASYAHPDEDQSDIPPSLRRPVAPQGFLNINIVGHCELLQESANWVYPVIVDEGWGIAASDLNIAVYTGADAHDLRSETNATRTIVDELCIRLINWPASVSSVDATHFVDFSTGGFSVFSRLTHSVIHDKGTTIISATSLTADPKSRFGSKADLFRSELDRVFSAPNWQNDYTHQLARFALDGRIYIDSPLARILGLPPVILAEASPPVSNDRFVAEASNAGYHVELCGSHMYREKAFRERVHRVHALLTPGHGFAVNIDYANQNQWSFQYPEVLRMRRDGVPITGLTISGGVPSADTGSAIIRDLQKTGIRHVSFHPDSALGIRQVLQIATASTGFPVLIQWMSRHTSSQKTAKDFHQPILETYSEIRSLHNVFLVLGLEFSVAEEALPYYTGEWSLQFDCARMPVDGVVPLSSQVMDTAGDTPADDINLSLVHDVRVIKELYQLVFSHPVDMHAGLLTTHREQIIRLLCSYSARPWFGINADGGVVELQDMTYMEVIGRLVELMYTCHKSQWLDISHRNLVSKFLRRVEDRFSKSTRLRIFQRHNMINDPAEKIENLLEVFPAICETQLFAEDVDYLVGLCRRTEGKGIPFVPIVDTDIYAWLKSGDYLAVKDSSLIANSEPWEMVVRGSHAPGVNADMVWLHTQGMVSSINAVLVDLIIQNQYDGDISRVPRVEYISPDIASAPPVSSVTSAINPSELTYVLPAEKARLPSADSWLSTLAGAEKSWLSALLTASDIIRGTRYARNAIRRILRPLPGHSVKVTLDNGFPSRLEVFDLQGMTDVSISIDKSRAITATIFHRIFENTFELELVYKYEPTLPISPIVEIGDGRLERIQSIMVAALKLGADIPDIEAVDVSLDAVPVKCKPYTVTEGLVRRLCNSVPNMLDSYMRHSDGTQLAPMDVLFYATWPGFAAIQMSPALYDGALDNVHLYNRFSLSEGAQLLHVGDIVDSDIRVTSLENTPIGRKVTLVSRLFRDGAQFATIESAVLSRNVFADYSQTFKAVDEPISRVTLVTAEDVAVLRSKEWFVYPMSSTDIELTVGQTLEFSLKSVYRYKSDKQYSYIQTTGSVYIVELAAKRYHIANVDYISIDVYGNAVVEYLKKSSVGVDQENTYENEGVPISKGDALTDSFVFAPKDNWEYAHVSGDYNIIHTNPYVANYVGLPGQICHGMWTSASTRAHVERFAANGDPSRVRSYQANFVGMVLPGDQLDTKLLHVGMKRGLMLVAGKTLNQHGDLVLTCTAEVEQPKSAYIFTGQGQSARTVWSRAERYMTHTYGVSLMHILKNNPKEYLVKFGGDVGRRIRSKYLSLQRTHAGVTTQLVPGITESSHHYIHKSANGLLNATLFTQPIQTVMSLAQIADMRAHGVVQEDAQFAGHSLGEIGSLAAMTEVLSVEDAVDIALYRGLLLHASVERDDQGLSQYAMVSVNPKSIGNGFSETHLQEIICQIRSRRQELLEVINYNVDGIQYVVTGHTDSLEAMKRVIGALVREHVVCSDPSSMATIRSAVQSVLAETIAGVALESGKGTTVIPGVDVPSHSSQLVSSVDSFRGVLVQRIPVTDCLPKKLCGRYIPNMTGTLFSISLGFIQDIYDICKSDAIHSILKSWNDSKYEESSARAQLAHTLLIELLAFQFASSVRWIDTQNTLFKYSAITRLVEIGPSGSLCRMARQTLTPEYGVRREVEFLHVGDDKDRIYFLDDPENTDPAAADNVSEKSVTESKHELLPSPIDSSPLLMEADTVQPSVAAQSIEDAPLQVTHILLSVVGQKLRKSMLDIPLSKSVKELVAGKSTLQNEIVGIMQKEFGKSFPNNVAEKPLQDVANSLGSIVSSLGKHSTAAIQRLFAAKIPSAFSQAKARAYLKSTYGLGRGRQDAVLLVATTLEPAKRLEDEAVAKPWLDDVVHKYSMLSGLVLSRESAHAITPHGHASTVVDSRELEALKNTQNSLALRQMQLLAESIGVNLQEGTKTVEEIRERLLEQTKEMEHIRGDIGDDFIQKTKPLFSSLKARRYNSYWNWARQDAMQWICDILSGKEDPDQETVSKRLHMLRNRSTSGLMKMLDGIIATLTGSTDPLSAKALLMAKNMHATCLNSTQADPVYRQLSAPLAPRTYINVKGDVIYSEIPRNGESDIMDYVRNMQKPDEEGVPHIYMCQKDKSRNWFYCESLSAKYFHGLTEIATRGLSFKGRVALVTGCGKNSIGSGLVEGLLSGGARVIATTSSFNMKSIRFFEEMYRKFGARGSELVLVPFNQASVQDVEQLFEYIYSKEGLGLDIDFVLPFAAFPEHGKDMTSVDSNSELTLRILLTNLYRMFGQIKAAKIKYSNLITPTVVVLPHSPNQGLIGDDGMYGETKAALHTLYNRWYTESWSEYLSITGGDIGWTRSTNMTYGSVNVYDSVEKNGIRTFSRDEMAFNILGLLTPEMIELSYNSPLFGSFNGGTLYDFDIKNIHASSRTQMANERSMRKAVLQALAEEGYAELLEDAGLLTYLHITDPLATHSIASPKVKSYEQLSHLHYLEGMVDLDKVVVVTGFGEVGPFGNSALRWEREAFGEFSIEGCIELAWIMGLIKHISGKHPTTGEDYIGWVDAQSLEPVRDADIKANYEDQILAHTGIRVLEKDMCESGDPYQKNFVSELQVDQDLEPFETTEEEAANYKRSHGKRVDVWANPAGSWSVKLLKGAIILVPKALRYTRSVAAQLPTGWDPVRLGLPQSLVGQMDPVNIYAVVATVEALVRSGITDPYEIYQYFHVSEVGHSVGSCIGGNTSLSGVFRGRWAERVSNPEVLLEASINTTSTWINSLILSASGPLKPSVGACATSTMTLDIAVETIQSGKAKIMVTGAVDALSQDISNELAIMSATADADDEAEHGRFPSEMCRPCTTTRNGFTEGYGSGIAVLMSASAAIEMGAPIYGVLAMSTTASDKLSRNFTAPGQGILTMGRESESSGNSPVLDIRFRRRMFNHNISYIESMVAESVRSGNDIPQHQITKLKKIAQSSWGNEFYKNDPTISPLRGALAAWGLGPDDIDIVSFHGTSTTLNDRNESEVVHTLLSQLGRTPGLPVPVVCQKWLTGHPKAVAAQVMMNGLLQAMDAGIVPGNENADNIDMGFEQYDYLVYPSRSYRVPTIKAALLTSFGLGQANGSALVVHPDYLLATLTKGELESYQAKNSERIRKSQGYVSDVLAGKHTFVQVKEAPPYRTDQEKHVYLDSLARAKYDPSTKSYHY